MGLPRKTTLTPRCSTIHILVRRDTTEVNTSHAFLFCGTEVPVYCTYVCSSTYSTVVNTRTYVSRPPAIQHPTHPTPDASPLSLSLSLTTVKQEIDDLPRHVCVPVFLYGTGTRTDSSERVWKSCKIVCMTKIHNQLSQRWRF